MILFAMGQRSYLTMMVMKKEKLNISIMMILPLIGIICCSYAMVYSLCMLFAHDTF